MTPAQLTAAAGEANELIAAAAATGTGAILASVGAAVTSAADVAPEVCAAVGAVLGGVAAHLPYISIAAGALGAIVVAFRMSKDDDANVATVLLWSSSVKDWLFLVAGRVERSAAESTAPLFKGLQDQLVLMCSQMEKHGKRGRLSKMMLSTSFRRDFERAKNSVLELKGALRDFLDQESQDAQEAKLAEIGDQQIRVNEQLETMDAQLGMIQQMLQAEAAAREEKEAKEAAMAVDINTSEEEAVFDKICKTAGVDGNEVPFKFFVTSFEAFFLKGVDMHPDVQRGLRISLDKDGSRKIYRVEFYKFWNAWKAADMPMEDYLLKLADEAPPTLYAQVGTAAAAATEKAQAVASDAAAAAKDMGARMGAAMGNISVKKPRLF